MDKSLFFIQTSIAFLLLSIGTAHSEQFEKQSTINDLNEVTYGSLEIKGIKPGINISEIEKITKNKCTKKESLNLGSFRKDLFTCALNNFTLAGKNVNGIVITSVNGTAYSVTFVIAAPFNEIVPVLDSKFGINKVTDEQIKSLTPEEKITLSTGCALVPEGNCAWGTNSGTDALAAGPSKDGNVTYIVMQATQAMIFITDRQRFIAFEKQQKRESNKAETIRRDTEKKAKDF